MKILLVDNFDSFTFNLADEFAKRGCLVDVWRNDLPAGDILAMAHASKEPVLIVLSPGPGTPQEAGSTMEIISRNAGEIPIFGVCLGHQAIVAAYGGEVASAKEIVHGKMSQLNHDGTGMFEGIPNAISVGRYHSLAATKLSREIVANAWSEDIVMAVRHEKDPIFGVKFHPESILTTFGGRMIENVLKMVVAH
jgi:anthranilate synthase/aminodeoxychorismate synthase-like glutamine amidotransferase